MRSHGRRSVGAEVAGIADRTGSLTPGKKADISNVKIVFVDGEALEENFELTASIDAPRRAVEESRDYLLEKFGEPEPGWLTAAG